MRAAPGSAARNPGSGDLRPAALGTAPRRRPDAPTPGPRFSHPGPRFSPQAAVSAPAAAMAERISQINPACRLTVLAEKYEAASREKFFAVPYDYIVDCIDLVSCKLDLIETALGRGIPIISSLGTGNKLDPSLFRISDLSKTEGCPLARVVRKELRARGIVHHRVLWSPEEPRAPIQTEAQPPGRRSVPGSVAWVPPAAGLMLAGDVVLTLAGLRA